MYKSREGLIEKVYLCLTSNIPLDSIHIPHSDVFYVREAIFRDTGVKYTLDHVERAMYLEGHLSRDEVLDPDRKRDGID